MYTQAVTLEEEEEFKRLEKMKELSEDPLERAGKDTEIVFHLDALVKLKGYNYACGFFHSLITRSIKNLPPSARDEVLDTLRKEFI